MRRASRLRREGCAGRRCVLLLAMAKYTTPDEFKVVAASSVAAALRMLVERNLVAHLPPALVQPRALFREARLYVKEVRARCPPVTLTIDIPNYSTLPTWHASL